MSINAKRVKAACYSTNLSMSVISNLSPVLFLTFHSQYGISYSLLGLLVLINFVTQLTIDLIFSFFSHRFRIPLAVKITPLLCVVGLFAYAILPTLFPDHVYLGLVIGTIIFSAAGGLGEVLISPVIAALPSDDPDREMSRLHSVYAWGVVGMVAISSLFLFFLGTAHWQWLALLFAIIPLCGCFLFLGACLPDLQTPERASGAFSLLKSHALLLCILGIFLGGAAEVTMAQWASGYLEGALGIPKLWGDLCGVALFSLMLGLGRTLYAKRGRHIERVLFLGACGATLCYLTAAISPFALIGLIACALCGFCVSMLWPGSLIAVTRHAPSGGVFVFAIMAAGGDLGASVGPQLVGIVTDAVAIAPFASRLTTRLSLTQEQLAMRCGLLVGFLLSLAAIFVFALIWKRSKKKT